MKTNENTNALSGDYIMSMWRVGSDMKSCHHPLFPFFLEGKGGPLRDFSKIDIESQHNNEYGIPTQTMHSPKQNMRLMGGGRQGVWTCHWIKCHRKNVTDVKVQNATQIKCRTDEMAQDNMQRG